MKRLLLLSLLAALVVAVPAQARAAAPCRDRIFNDWYADGKIASTYPHACYVDALRHIPADAEEYSSLREDITRRDARGDPAFGGPGRAEAGRPRVCRAQRARVGRTVVHAVGAS